MNPRKNEYYKYLNEHIGGVKSSWNNILKPYMIDNGYEYYIIDLADSHMVEHDLSKLEDAEFIMMNLHLILYGYIINM